ncbi:hypothetical protein LJ739_09160 [Aestuariibacter halophilus]|uniref:Uncharacterized protein n=1 Tax=Fluctibacter halophilus TaxID=226011 RepID=A0ABS8G735_9ALTE|nr:hypothetical protein [Aestuariibacter halophilus]MCC2616407.1 hypothetical protein [Aestuariibacter halophilus]
MIRSLIIILEIAVLVTLLRTSFVQYFLSDIQVSLSDWMTEVSLIAERQELDALRDAIAPVTTHMRDYQKAYMEDITSRKVKVQNFHHLYCEKGDKNPYVYGASLSQICSAIRQSHLLAS